MDDSKERIEVPPSVRSTCPRLAMFIDRLNCDDPAVRQETEAVLAERGLTLESQLVSLATGTGHHVAFRMCMLDLLERIGRPSDPQAWMDLDHLWRTTQSKRLKAKIWRVLTAHTRNTHMEVPK